MAPVIKELNRRPDRFEQTIIATAQHREMLDQVLSAFGIEPGVDLDLMETDQGLAAFASRSLVALSALFSKLSPDVVIVQGDTTTVMTAGLAAFYLGIPIGHVEAGLRSHDNQNPFPEEVNRRIVSTLAGLHFAPTDLARRNLIKEGIQESDVFVTGNTVVDALMSFPLDERFANQTLNAIDFTNQRVLLVTAHRRENHGERLRGICTALRSLANSDQDVAIVYPVHLNPRVQQVVREQLDGLPNVYLTPPLSYSDLVRLMARCYLILTDSGGIQEEAPSFHKPVLVLREVTERPELIDAGGGRLVGTDPSRIVDAAMHLILDIGEYDKMSRVGNPFGDGRAAARIADLLEMRFPER
jgi:UDP-N-acetylglucosamine 2-epimerase (non-hydrolysing)